MRRLFLIVFFGLNLSFNNADLSRLTSSSEYNFDWILGDWIRVNEKEDRKTFETWVKKNNSEYKGFGFTILNRDTIWQENVQLIESAQGWNFQVTGKGEDKPTVFILTEIEKDHFTCENADNEFPKKIEYFKNGQKLEAVISGGSIKIPFEFERVSMSKY